MANASHPGELHQGGLDDYSDEELLDALLVDEVRTLQDIELLYGGLFALATASDDPGTARYLTPTEANEWFDEDERVLVLRFDLSNAMADSYVGMQPLAHGPDLIPKLGHARYAAGQGIDHSITHMFKERADPKQVAVGRLTEWATASAVQSVVDDDAVDDAWVIEALAELGEDEDVVSEIQQDIERVERSDGGLMTVQVKLEDDGEWLWPSDVDALTEGMKRLRRDRMATKNIKGDGESVGHGVCFSTGTPGIVYGTSDDPMRMFLTRQYEKFPAHHISESWTTHPVSLEAALDVDAAEPFLEACQVRTFRGMAYHLPYFPGEVTADRVQNLFYTLVHLVEESDDANAPTTRALKSIGDYADELRFYTLLVQQSDNLRWNVLGEMQNESGFPAADIADAHDTLLDTAWFNRDDDWAFYTGEMSFFQRSGTLDAVASGWYLKQTLPDREQNRDASNTDIRPDDPRVQAFNALLAGRPISYQTLVSWYVERLVDEERENMQENESDTDDSSDFPWWCITKQFTQLCALADAGLVATEDGDSAPILGTSSATVAPTDNPQTNLESPIEQNMTATDTETDSEDDDQNRVEIRRERLEEFIDNHPPLRDDHEKRSAFLLGMLVGQLDGVQGQNVESTVVDAHPIASISKNNLHRITNDVLHRNNIYAKKAPGNSSRMFTEVTEPLSDAMLSTDPTEWEITNEMVQFYYGLGIERGQMNPSSDDEGEKDADTTRETETAEK